MRHRYKPHPLWHQVQCLDCGNLFDEYSDPAASLELCHNCLRKRWGAEKGEEPLQKDLNADQWWDDFVYEYERQKSLGVIDAYGRETNASKTLSP